MTDTLTLEDIDRIAESERAFQYGETNGRHWRNNDVALLIEYANERAARETAQEAAAAKGHVLNELICAATDSLRGWAASTTSMLTVGRYHYQGVGPTPTAAYLALIAALGHE